MVYDNSHIKSRLTLGLHGFTMAEVLIAIALVGIGISSTVAALTKLNSFASTSRNATGAYALAMYQIDSIQSATPFNPLVPGQFPNILNPANSPIVEDDLPIYIDPGTNLMVVLGKRTTTIATVPVSGVTMYQVTVKVEYPKPSFRYSLSMSTLRVSDQ